jgi:hypothetical protein
MVYSILKKFNVKDVISVKADEAMKQEGFKVGNEEVMDTANWNPFIFAVAHQQNSVMNYFINTTSHGLGLPVKYLSQ